MSQVLFTGFRPIKAVQEYFHSASLKSGEKLYDAGHVSSVTEVDGVDVRAKCRSQQGKQVYSISLHLSDKDRQIQGGHCSCRYGAAGTCKHCAAVTLYINLHEAVSCTSQRQKWGKPAKKPRVDDKASIEELFGANKHPHVGGAEAPEPLDPSFLTKHFPDIDCPMARILKTKNETCEGSCKTVLQDIVSKIVLEEDIRQLKTVLHEPKEAFYSLKVVGDFPKIVIRKREHEEEMTTEVADYYAKHIKCTSSLRLCALTKGQASNFRWHQERKPRITCSQAHTILRTRKSPQDLLQTIFNRRGFYTEATSYGIKMEPVARKEFEKKVGTHVVEAGLVVHPTQPWLCGSPDGLFETANGVCLLEIKCPFSRRDNFIIDAEQLVTFVPYIKYVNNKLTLQPSHQYYTQVQLLMYICNLTECFFFVYSTKHSISVTVQRDNSFLCSAVRALEDFYFTWLLPTLIKKP